ncbi:uncharacterized protein LOC113386514 [Ctenocephalides felis]|uniref:uncharacterized protein LOC113386514 n=1 Tax=Ctenocephalides felis TaxID=7515 RepID=UPI000E6E3F73|nr:uncharacterized protein LOC113386514 [Ctenocephalides felis]
MSENNLTLAEIARCFRLEESELASLLVSADNDVAERELASMLQSADILPPELSNHKLEKEYFITGTTTEDLFMKQNEVENFIELQRKFTEICPDYADELTPNNRLKHSNLLQR